MTADLAALLLAAVLPTQDQPAILRVALKAHPQLVLFDPAVDAPDGYSVAELASFGYWPPWKNGDYDRDGHQDVVAVVVERTGDQPRFGVIAVLGKAPRSLLWLEGLQNAAIYGVAAGPAADTVVPLHCIECDSNEWYRWSGVAFEALLYAPGERVAIATYSTEPAVGVFRKADRNSGMLLSVQPCTPAKVVAVRGTSFGDRWYQVDVQVTPLVRGWLPAAWVMEHDCGP